MDFDPLFLLRVYTHFFKISRPTARMIGLLRLYCNQYTSYIFVKERGKWTRRADKLFGGKTIDNTEFRFHINQLAEFKEFLSRNHITPNLYREEYEPLLPPQTYNIPVRQGWSEYDYQVPIVDYQIAKDGNRSKLIGIQTGKGKTSTALFAVSKLGYRTLIMIKPAYIEKWCGDVTNVLDQSTMDIMVVQGGDHLRGIIELAKHGRLKANFIIMSNRTYQNYVKAYETDPWGEEYQSYECHPENLFPLLGIGEVLIDEVHQEFYATFKMLMYTHVDVVVAMSATLLTRDSFLEKMYNIAFPRQVRYDGLEVDKYIKVYPVAYNFYKPEKIRLTEWGANNYSHTAFEKSIQRHHQTLQNYLELIRYVMDIGFVRGHLPGDKIMVFAATISMCTEITRYLSRRFPQYDVRRYVEEDPYENAMEAEVIVSTLQSAGTALDIKGLRTVIMTVNVDSPSANVQTVGRLRKLPDRDVKFYYFYCEQFDKHKDYNRRRETLLTNHVASIKHTVYPNKV